MNKQHPQIQFIREEEVNSQINFLGVPVKRETTGFSTMVYIRKPTHSDIYTHSHHTTTRE